MPVATRYGRPFWVAVILAFATSCGPESVPCHPVSGQVLVNGKPAELAFVVFHPLQGSEEVAKLRPRGKTDADGRYTLMTYWDGDGAPAGDYKVTITWQGPPPAEPYHPDELSSRPDLLRGRYEDPDRSTLTATVTSGDNEIAAFDVGS